MKVTAPKTAPLIDLLLAIFAPASKTRVRKMIKHGQIRVDGAMVTREDTMINAGQLIVYEKTMVAKPKGRAPVPILFEDAHLLVADKPVGLLTYGERGSGGTSLYRMLKEYLRKGREREEIFVVHRLDREVSGLILFAKSEHLQERLKTDWNKTRKLYRALVEGRVKDASGTVSGWLKEGADRKMYVVEGAHLAKWAVTHYRVVEQLAEHTVLDIELSTGRKNQIRAHLAHLGHPVVGDRRYGASAEFIRRIRLHASLLEFTHPVTNQPMTFTSPLPKNFLLLEAKNEEYK